MRKTIIFLALLLLGLSLGAEPFTIGEVTYKVQGNSREYFLENLLGIQKAGPFATQEELELYLAGLRQTLINQRLFDEVDVQHEIQGDSVNITVLLKDTWNIVPIAIPLYDSNVGFKVSYKLYYSNILGTLMNTKVEGNYNWYPGSGPSDWVTNFNKPRNWYSQFTIDRIKLGNTTWKASTDIRYITEESANPENPEELDINFSYMENSYQLATSFSLPGRFSWGPSFSISRTFDYKLKKDAPNLGVSTADTIDLGFSHGLGYGKVNWVGNFKEGYSFSLGNGYAIDPTNDKVNVNLTADAKYYYPWKFLGLGTKVQGFYEFDDERYSAAGPIRGVADNRLRGHQGLFWANNVAIKLIDPYGWELQAIPFLDMGLAWQKNESLSKENFQVGSGLEIVLFPGFTKSFLFRLSGGISLLDSRIDPEIDMTASLSF